MDAASASRLLTIPLKHAATQVGGRPFNLVSEWLSGDRVDREGDGDLR